ncbi:TraR/DksA C4-type zinc finger protein [Kribbella sp. NPDC003557]|uniref:TraR/DksA family transcriptional regulator n=1 Tax=Kribbella sp. NPDC003557 TaxID=3154449 RepID=UPI0033BAD45A
MLGRIHAGCYSLCSRCGRAIAPERLKALPVASLCMECQHAKESTVQPTERLRASDISPAQDSTAEPRGGEPSVRDIVEVWGFSSFPASDPPANW